MRSTSPSRAKTFNT
jgi:hypothetical protein